MVSATSYLEERCAGVVRKKSISPFTILVLTKLQGKPRAELPV